MRVVLLDDIVNVGDAGTIAEVKNGYARNFLIPRGLAELATADAINRVELIRRGAEVKRAKRRSEAAGKFQQLEGKTVTILVKAGTAGRIFGSITSAAIVDEAKKQLGVSLDRRHVMLEEPLRHLGEFTVPLRAAADVTGELRVVVEPEGGQRGRGRSAAYGAGGPTEPAPAAPKAEAAEGAEGAEQGAEDAQNAAGEGATGTEGEVAAEGEAAAGAESATATADGEPAEEPYEDLENQVAG